MIILFTCFPNEMLKADKNSNNLQFNQFVLYKINDKCSEEMSENNNKGNHHNREKRNKNFYQ